MFNISKEKDQAKYRMIHLLLDLVTVLRQTFCTKVKYVEKNKNVLVSKICLFQFFKRAKVKKTKEKEKFRPPLLTRQSTENVSWTSV